MPVAFDTSGMEQYDERTWFDPRTGDQVSLTYIGMVPDLPAGLDEVPLLRHRLALETAEVGALIEAHVVTVDTVPTLFQLLKVPIPDQEMGQAFIAAFTVPKATCSAVLRIQCAEDNTRTGAREAAVARQVGTDVQPHPYAPEATGLLPTHVADDAQWDAQFPDHPLTRARAWAHRMIATARLDPEFAQLPPFQPAPSGGAETFPRLVPVRGDGSWPASPEPASPGSSAATPPEEPRPSPTPRPKPRPTGEPRLRAVPPLASGPDLGTDPAQVWQAPPTDPQPPGTVASSTGRHQAPIDGPAMTRLSAVDPVVGDFGVIQPAPAAGPAEEAADTDVAKRERRRAAEDPASDADQSEVADDPALTATCAASAGMDLALANPGEQGAETGRDTSGTPVAEDEGHGGPPPSGHPDLEGPPPAADLAATPPVGRTSRAATTPTVGDAVREAPNALRTDPGTDLEGPPPASADRGGATSADDPARSSRLAPAGVAPSVTGSRKPESAGAESRAVRPEDGDAAGVAEVVPSRVADGAGPSGAVDPADQLHPTVELRRSPSAAPDRAQEELDSPLAAEPGGHPHRTVELRRSPSAAASPGRHDESGAPPEAFVSAGHDQPGAPPAGAGPAHQEQDTSPAAAAPIRPDRPGTLSAAASPARHERSASSVADAGPAHHDQPGTALASPAHQEQDASEAATPTRHDQPGTPPTAASPAHQEPGTSPATATLISHDRPGAPRAAANPARHEQPGTPPTTTNPAHQEPGTSPAAATPISHDQPGTPRAAANPARHEQPAASPAAAGTTHHDQPAAAANPARHGQPDTPPAPTSAERHEQPATPPAAANPARHEQPATPPTADNLTRQGQPSPSPAAATPAHHEQPAMSLATIGRERHEQPAIPPAAPGNPSRHGQPDTPPAPTSAEHHEQPATPPTGTRHRDQPAAPPAAAARYEEPSTPPAVADLAHQDQPGTPPVAANPARHGQADTAPTTTGPAYQDKQEAPLAVAESADGPGRVNSPSAAPVPAAARSARRALGVSPSAESEASAPSPFGPTDPAAPDAGWTPPAIPDPEQPKGEPAPTTTPPPPAAVPALAEPESLPRPSSPATTGRHKHRVARADKRPASTVINLPTAAPSAVAKPLSPGEAMHTVLVGMPVGDYLALWLTNEISYWRMAQPDLVRERIGAGLGSRSEIDHLRFREVALLSQDKQTLFLTDRFRDRDGQLGGTTVHLLPAIEDEAFADIDDKASSEFYRWLGDMVLAAAERDEYVAVESGGWHVPRTPTVTAMLRPDGEEWQSVVEASPVPVGAPVWRDQQPVRGNSQLLVSPATEQTLRAAGLLIRFAVSTWSLHPLQLGLSFGPNPTLGEIPTR